MKTGKIIAVSILIIAVAVMGYAGYKVIEANRIYAEGNAAYEVLREMVQEDEFMLRKIDFDALCAINEDIVAWLYNPGTMIDYPVLKAKDYNQYLRHLPDGKYNMNGSLFIDHHNAPDFSDLTTVIYGHHMKSGAMFGSLVGYKEQAYYDQHPVMYLYTPQGSHKVNILYGCIIAAGQWGKLRFMFPENLPELLSYAAEHTTFTSETEYAEGDRIIAMATCSYEFDDARYIVLGILSE